MCTLWLAKFFFLLLFFNKFCQKSNPDSFMRLYENSLKEILKLLIMSFVSCSDTETSRLKGLNGNSPLSYWQLTMDMAVNDVLFDPRNS